MSKREEIDKKKQLQARLQVSFSMVDSKIASWMGEDVKEDKFTKSSFDQLPIIEPGKGLNLADDEQSTKVADFVRPRKGSTKVIKRRREESASMRALRNKMRDTKRQKLQREQVSKKPEPDSDSDSEAEVPQSKPKKVAKGKRPF